MKILVSRQFLADVADVLETLIDVAEGFATHNDLDLACDLQSDLKRLIRENPAPPTCGAKED